ncbi:MAG: YfhO family protein [Clostridiales bacterium]|jgi:uncharacterized membrane protein YfhO|nr:YfhO family protein [Clostridiales bacterium]
MAFKNAKWPLISYASVMIILFAVFVAMNIYPFGNLTLIKNDLFSSFAPLANEFREAILSGKSLLYSWQGGLGVNLLPNVFNALLSPFSLIILLFPAKYITELYLLYFLVKIPCAAASFSYFLGKRYGDCGVWSCIFSVGYALCSYVTAYYQNIMWLDSVIILPILAASIWKIIDGGKPAFFSVILSIGIITSFYTGIYLCLFSAAYFIIEAFLHLPRDRKIILKKAADFAISSLLGGGIAAFVLIPVVFAVSYTHYAQEPLPKSIEIYNGLFSLLLQHFFGVYPSVAAFAENGPNIYSGVFSFLLLPLYFANSKISKREKIIAGSSMLLLIAGFNVNILSYMLHGMHFSAWFPHRFSFIYSFLVLILACKSVLNLSGIKAGSAAIIFIASIILPFALYNLFPQKIIIKPGIFTEFNLWTNTALIAFYFFMLSLLRRKPGKKFCIQRKHACAAILAATLAEAGVGAYFNFSVKNDGVRDSYIQEYYDSMKEILQPISLEKEFYRAEFKHYRSQGDPKLYGYAGVNTFNPFIYSSAQEFLRVMGFNSSYNTISMGHPTALMNSVMSIKYLFNKNKEMSDSFTLFELSGASGKIYAYENPYALPLGFMADSTIDDLDAFRYMDMPTESFSAFQAQNDFAKKASGISSDIFSPLPEGKPEVQFLQITSSTESGVHSYELDEGLPLDAVPTATYEFFSRESKWTYIHLLSGGATRAHVWVGDRYVLDQALKGDAMTLDAGFVESESKIKVVVDLNRKRTEDGEEFIKNGVFRLLAAQMDFDAYESVVFHFESQPLIVTQYSETSINAEIEVENKGTLFTSIPYDKGWEVDVDGKKVDEDEFLMNKVFISFPLAQGKHVITMRYRQRGLSLGAAISCFSALLLLFRCAARRKSTASH